MILDSIWKHQRTIHSCYGIKSCDFGPNRGLGIFITDMSSFFFFKSFSLRNMTLRGMLPAYS